MTNWHCITVISHEYQCILDNCPIDFLFESLFRLTRNISSLLVLCEENPHITSGFPSQSGNNVESIYMSLCHHYIKACLLGWPLALTTCLQSTWHVDIHIVWDVTWILAAFQPSRSLTCCMHALQTEPRKNTPSLLTISLTLTREIWHDVTRVSRHFRTLPTWFFVQKFAQDNNKGVIKALYYCPFPLVTDGFPSQMDSNIESISTSWLHHDIKACLSGWPLTLTVCFTQHMSCRYSHSMRCNMDPGSIPAAQDPDTLYAGITD